MHEHKSNGNECVSKTKIVWKAELPGSRICFQVFSHLKYSPIIILVSLLPSLLRARHTWSGEPAMWIIPSQLSAQRIITNNCLRFCLKQGCRWKVALALYAWIAESSVCNCHALTNSKRPFVCFALTLQMPTMYIYSSMSCSQMKNDAMKVPWMAHLKNISSVSSARS